MSSLRLGIHLLCLLTVDYSAMKNDRDVNAEDGPSLEQTAHALYDTFGRFSDKDAPPQVRVWSPLVDLSQLYESEELRSCSANEIARLMRPLYVTPHYASS